jgi:hypothetical protein
MTEAKIRVMDEDDLAKVRSKKDPAGLLRAVQKWVRGRNEAERRTKSGLTIANEIHQANCYDKQGSGGVDR